MNLVTSAGVLLWEYKKYSRDGFFGGEDTDSEPEATQPEIVATANASAAGGGGGQLKYYDNNGEYTDAEAGECGSPTSCYYYSGTCNGQGGNSYGTYSPGAAGGFYGHGESSYYWGDYMYGGKAFIYVDGKFGLFELLIN